MDSYVQPPLLQQMVKSPEFHQEAPLYAEIERHTALLFEVDFKGKTERVELNSVVYLSWASIWDILIHLFVKRNVKIKCSLKSSSFQAIECLCTSLFEYLALRSTRIKRYALRMLWLKS